MDLDRVQWSNAGAKGRAGRDGESKSVAITVGVARIYQALEQGLWMPFVSTEPYLGDYSTLTLWAVLSWQTRRIAARAV